MRLTAWAVFLAAGTAIAASPDGTCGGYNGYSCWGSFFGNCCGSDGKCGSTIDKCTSGCQKEFGWCSEQSSYEKREGPGYGYGSGPGGDKSSSTPLGAIETSSSSYASSSYALSYSYPSSSYSPSYSTPFAAISTSSSGYPSYASGAPSGYLSAPSSAVSSPGGPIGASSSLSPYPSVSSSAYPSSFPSGYPGDDEDDEDCGCDDEEDESSTPSGPLITGSSGYPFSYPTGGPSSYASFPTGSGSTSAGPIGGSNSSPPYPSGGLSGYPSGGYGSGYPRGSGYPTGYPSGTGPVSTPVGPIGTGTSSYPSYPSGTGASSYPLYPSGGSSSYPSGYPSSSGSVTSKPSGTSPSGSVSASGSIGTTSSSTTCSSTPKPTAGYLPNCVPCEGQPNSNDKFCGYDASTNWYESTPKTCKVVEYTFDITDETVSPDGISRPAMLVNGQMPGPTISASWGDTVVVHVNNKLTSKNGTSIHFHGMRQLNNSENDGVPSIVQCPVAPGESLTYQFVAENYGTSWWHSHYALQAWEGVHGPMVIDGPHSDDSFDEDLGPIILQDWSHFTVDSRYDVAQNATVNPETNQTFGGPVVMDSGLINGKNVWGDDGAANQTGSRTEFSFTAGKKYLLRIINTSIQSTYKFYIDGHTMTVISADFVPIQPYTTDIVNVNIGQRYNVIVEASQSSGSFWMRSDNQNACAGTVQAKNIKAIVNYGSSSGSLPTSTGYNYTDECIDEPYDKLVPYVSLDAATEDTTLLGGATNVVVAANNANLFKWYLGGTTFFSEYDDPTLLDIYNNGSTPDYSGNLLVKVPNAKEMVYLIIETTVGLPHPIHLHGHDFWVLAQGEGTYGSKTTLNLANPPRRDTALMPATGYIVLAFVTDNPGVWLMHCHIGWHTSMGFALQIVEQQDKVKKTVKDSCMIKDTCSAWDKWSDANDVAVIDSGV